MSNIYNVNRIGFQVPVCTKSFKGATPPFKNNESSNESKNNILPWTVAVASSATAIAFGLRYYKLSTNYPKDASLLASKVENLVKNNAKIKKQNEKLSKSISDLKLKLDTALSINNKKNITDTEFKNKVLEDLKDGKLPYNSFDIPKNEYSGYKWSTSCQNRIAYKPFAVKTNPTNELSDLKTSNLIEKLKLNGKVKFEIPNEGGASSKQAEDAKIAGQQIKDLGKTVETDMKITYGANTAWTDEKISRDILQNFYDGHGHTLEGVKFDIQKIHDKYKVRISGDSTYSYDKIKNIGDSTKSGDLYSAGGFGEGSKVISASMLNKLDTTYVKYGSSDWNITYERNSDNVKTAMMTRKICNVPEEKGNFIEFDTKDKSFIEKLINAKDYFYHPHNPDFNNFTFENKDFAFKYLGKGKKGNLYMTQRFEYNDNGKWENNVDDMTIVFKRKPDKSFNIGRDRTYLDNNDIKMLSKSFAKNMTNEELTSSISSLKDIWEKETNPLKKNTTTASKAFLKGLIEESSSRNLGIDFNGLKVASEYLENENIDNFLRSEGYMICDSELKYIAMPSANEVLASLSKHTSVTPTPVEVKKIKIIRKAVQLIQQGMNNLVTSKNLEKISKMDIQIDDKKFLSLCNDTSFWVRLKTNSKLKDLVKNEKDLEKVQNAISGKDLKEAKEIVLNSIKNNYKNEIIQSVKLENSSDLRELLNINKNNNFINFSGIKTEDGRIMVEDIIEKPLLSAKDAQCPQFVFNSVIEKQDSTLAEAIINDKGYQGHWVAQKHLENATFSEMLATWLHEMTHQYAGDGTMDFGYKLTDVMGEALGSTTKDNSLAQKLSTLEQLYKDIDKQG